MTETTLHENQVKRIKSKIKELLNCWKTPILPADVGTKEGLNPQRTIPITFFQVFEKAGQVCDVKLAISHTCITAMGLWAMTSLLQ